MERGWRFACEPCAVRFEDSRPAATASSPPLALQLLVAHALLLLREAAPQAPAAIVAPIVAAISELVHAELSV